MLDARVGSAVADEVAAAVVLLPAQALGLHGRDVDHEADDDGDEPQDPRGREHARPHPVAHWPRLAPVADVARLDADADHEQHLGEPEADPARVFDDTGTRACQLPFRINRRAERHCVRRIEALSSDRYHVRKNRQQVCQVSVVAEDATRGWSCATARPAEAESGTATATSMYACSANMATASRMKAPTA